MVRQSERRGVYLGKALSCSFDDARRFPVWPFKGSLPACRRGLSASKLATHGNRWLQQQTETPWTADAEFEEYRRMAAIEDEKCFYRALRAHLERERAVA